MLSSLFRWPRRALGMLCAAIGLGLTMWVARPLIYAGAWLADVNIEDIDVDD